MNNWYPAPTTIRLDDNEVHVWKQYLNLPAQASAFFQAVLTPEELSKARKFYFEKDRQAWTIAHGRLRLLLATYLNIANPSSIRFRQNDYGKPALDQPDPNIALEFNLSHSEKIALYAITLRRTVGIDVEYMRTIDYNALAKHSFSHREQEELQHVPPEMLKQAFYNCWTRKEAYIKARGMGLSLALDSFDVSLKPGDPARLLGSRERYGETERWSMQACTPDPDYAGALVVEGSGWSVQYWQCPDHMIYS